MQLKPKTQFYFQLKKSFKKVGKTDSVKMYTWSPYTSSLFFTDPKMVTIAPGIAQPGPGAPGDHPMGLGMQF